MPNEITMGENSEQLLVISRNHGCTRPNRGHRFKDRANVGVWPNDSKRTTWTHDLMHTDEETAPKRAAGMKLGEILFLETARFEQHHRERVAEREHDRRARSGSKVQRTCFLLNVHIEEHV